jgi:hypothetical protein
MNLVIFIDGVQMFVRNFGLSHVSAAFGDFGIELAGPKAGRIIIALFERPVEWLRSRLGRQVPEKFLLLACCVLFAGCATSQPPVLHKLSANRGAKLAPPLRARSVAPCPEGWSEVAPATSTDVFCETTIWKKAEATR